MAARIEQRTGKRGPRYRVNTTIGGKLIRSPWGTEEQAQAWLAAYLASKPTGIDNVRSKPGNNYLFVTDKSYQLPTAPNVSQVLDFYLAARKRLRSAVRYVQLAAHLKRLLGDRETVKLRQADIDRYHDTRVADEKAADKTAWNELALLRSAARYAYQNDLITEAPKWGLWTSKCARKKILSPEAVAAIMALADRSLGTAILAMYTMMLRLGELLRAKVEDVDRQAHVLRIPVTKQGTPAEVPIPKELWDRLDLTGDYLFTNKDSPYNRLKDKKGHLTYQWEHNTLRRMFNDIAKQAGYTGYRLHDLRRSGASNLAKKGVPLAVVRETGRWETTEALLEHYQHATEGSTQAATEQLANGLKLNGNGTKIHPSTHGLENGSSNGTETQEEFGSARELNPSNLDKLTIVSSLLEAHPWILGCLGLAKVLNGNGPKK